jgi:hypothetical protein
LIQTILGCVKGDEVAILSQHPDLVDEGNSIEKNHNLHDEVLVFMNLCINARVAMLNGGRLEHSQKFKPTLG